jgi:uncharacterized delta-60 repeat protein
MKKCLLLLLAANWLMILNAQIGSLDTGFGDKGIQLYTHAPVITGNVFKVLPTTGNYYYKIFSTSTYGEAAISIAKYSSDGTLETSFGTDGFSDNLAIHFADAAIQEDGKLIIAGSTTGFLYGDIHDDELVARFTTSGKLDLGFGNAGLFRKTYTAFSYEFTRSLVITNNQLVVKGYSKSLVGGFGFNHIDIIDQNGTNTNTLNLAFSPSLQQFYPEYYNYDIAFQGQKILLATSAPDLTGNGNFYTLQRYLANGSPDAGFGINGSTALGNAFFNGQPIVANQGEKIVVAAYSLNPISKNYGFAVGRYNNDGSFDNGFNGNGMQTIDFGDINPVAPKALICRGDTVYIGGNKYNATTNALDFAIACLDKHGLPDSLFNGNGKQVTGISDHSFSLEKMAVTENRLAVLGRAYSGTKGLTVVKALYMLEDNSLVLTCPADTTVFTDKGKCTAIVKGIHPKINGLDNSTNIRYALTGATTAAGQGAVSGLSFNKGLTLVNYTTITDPSKKGSFRVSVLDKEAPVITGVSTSPAYLCPANHKMKPVEINYLATDNCGPVTTQLSITSNEPQKDKNDDSDEPDDWSITDAHHILLRAERSGKGSGRIYTIRIITTDAAGNADTALVTVSVPRNTHGQPDCNGNENLNAKAFPNPTRNYFTIQTNSNDNQKLTLNVFNQLGRLIEFRSNIPANSSIQIGHRYAKGIYLVELIQGKQRTILRLIKAADSFLNY